MRSWTLLSLALCLAGCTNVAGPAESDRGPARDGKQDSGWLSSESYELGALVRASVEVDTTAWGFEDVADSGGTQIDLLDQQIRYAKNTAEDLGYRLNLVADEVEITATEIDGETFRMEYVAVVDLIARLPQDGAPTLSDLEVSEFSASVPLNPVGVRSRASDSCAENDGHSFSDGNYAYYFRPDEECTLELTPMHVEVTEVFQRTEAFPEYDQLLQPLDDAYGFRAALVPATADRGALGWHDLLKEMLEGDLDLEGTVNEDEGYTRYVFRDGDAAIEIDLYDPTATRFDSRFRDALGDYQFLYYLGHSSYGNQHLLDAPEAYSDDYQIITMHSCQSYAYYVQQVFRAKETADDPHGWDRADVVATGPSTPATGAPSSLRELLSGLLDGMADVVEGQPERAPDWLSIIEDMNRVDPWSMFGAAGVRENTWQP